MPLSVLQFILLTANWANVLRHGAIVKKKKKKKNSRRKYLHCCKMTYGPFTHVSLCIYRVLGLHSIKVKCTYCYILLGSYPCDMLCMIIFEGLVHPITKSIAIVILNYHALNQIQLAFTSGHSLKFTNVPINNTIPAGKE